MSSHHHNIIPRAPLDPTPLHAFRRHLRLWRRFVLQALVRETHYRANLIITTSVGLLQLAISLIPVLLLFSFTEEINGWSQGDAIALSGMYQLAVAIFWFGIETNMERISTYIRQGDLDLILVRPVSGLFYVMLRWVKPAEVFMVLSGLAVTVIGLSRTGTTPNATGLLQALLLLVAGVILMSCAWTAIVMTAFWFTTTGPVSMVASDLIQAGRYPLSFYPTAIRLFLAFVFPVGFVTTFPVESLVGRGNWTIVLIGVALSGAALVALRVWWRHAVRFYSSASS
jgi:ABC-2 type transport system permease protein